MSVVAQFWPTITVKPQTEAGSRINASPGYRRGVKVTSTDNLGLCMFCMKTSYRAEVRYLCSEKLSASGVLPPNPLTRGSVPGARWEHSYPAQTIWPGAPPLDPSWGPNARPHKTSNTPKPRSPKLEVRCRIDTAEWPLAIARSNVQLQRQLKLFQFLRTSPIDPSGNRIRPSPPDPLFFAGTSFRKSQISLWH